MTIRRIIAAAVTSSMLFSVFPRFSYARVATLTQNSRPKCSLAGP